MKNLINLTLLAGALALTTPAHAWIAVRRPVYVAPYVAPYSYNYNYNYSAPTVIVTGGPGDTAMVPPPNPVGSIFYTLPTGAQSANINGVQYYVAGTTYYSPSFGPNGVYYTVVPNPI